MKEHRADESRRKLLAALAAAPAAALLTGCSMEVEGAGEALEMETSALTVPQLQALCNAFYAMTNVVEIRISMPPPDWDSVCLEEPTGGFCAWNNPPEVSRYPWHIATSVTISGSVTPTARTFTNVGIKKKSHCGSFSTTKPSLKLDFNEFDKNKDAIEALIGTSHLTLNNCVQDPSFIRQALAYFLFKQGSLPASRCNFCRVFVNNNLVGVYANVEPIRERFIENNFNQNLGGNLYELEYSDDFVTARLPFIDVEKVSRFTDKKDLGVAATEIAKGATAMRNVIDVNQFIAFHAMEILLKHWDSYDGRDARGNNTYVYNDVQAVANPTVAGMNVRFKFIPSGTDQILQSGAEFGIRNSAASGLCGQRVRGDTNMLAQLRSQIRSYASTVFSRANITGPIKQFIDQMQMILNNLGVGSAASAGIAEVRQQLTLVRSAAWSLGGLSDASIYIKDPSTGDCMRASQSQRVGGATTGSDFEVVHRQPVDDANDRWRFDGQRFVNEANGGWLHCSNSFRTPVNHLMVYTTLNNDTLGSKDFIILPEQTSFTNSFCVTGRFKFSNRRNGLFLKFGTDDPTPGTGAQRVYQAGINDATLLTIY